MKTDASAPKNGASSMDQKGIDRGGMAQGTAERALTRWEKFPSLPLLLSAAVLAFTALPRVRETSGLFWSFVGASAFLFVWSLVLWAKVRRTGGGLRMDFVAPAKAHFIQGSVQLCVYLYWAQYWPDLQAQFPLIFAQLVFLYGFEALLSWTRGRNWRVGFGPLPIILSTNVFLWFEDPWFVFQFVLISTSALGKEFIKWNREGRRTHIFNPSAFGLALFAAILLITGTTDQTWAGRIADAFAQPTHIYVVVFGLGLIVQYMFGVTLMTLSAAATLALASLVFYWSTGTYFFIFSNIPAPVFLGLHLLVTDPATSPRSNIGKVIFGVGYGVLTFGFYAVLTSLDQPTVYDKLLPIPILNLLVPSIDRLARGEFFTRVMQWEKAFRPRALNAAHMAVWAVFFTFMLSTGFVQGEHEGGNIFFWKKAYAEGRPNSGRGLLEVVKSNARSGSGPAWNELGSIYLEGKIVERNDELAVSYFARASRLGSVAGSANLAKIYLSNEHHRDSVAVARAFDHLEQQCAQGTDAAIYYLVGAAYETGRGRPLDVARARAVYGDGCARGNALACESVRRIEASRSAKREPSNAGR